MALETSGFQLSQLESAPQIPGNIGVVDTKSIYGAVVDALKANEALRTTQAAQAATDAELALAQQKAQTEMGLLGPEAEARKAKAQLFTAGAPYQMEQLGLGAEAEKQKLQADIVRNRILAEPAMARQVIEGRTLAPSVKAQMQFQKILDQGGLSEEAALAIRAKLGQVLSVEQLAKLNANRNQVHQAVVDGQVVQWRNDGAIRYPGQTDWMFGAALPGGILSTSAPSTGAAPLATEAAPVSLAPATGAPATGVPAAGAPATGGGILSSEGAGVRLGGESGAQKRAAAAKVKRSEKSQEFYEKVGQKVLEDQGAELQKLPKVLSSINSLVDTTELVDRTIDDAIAKVYENSRVTGGGKPGELIRDWVTPEAASDFSGDLDTIKANIGFGALQKIRQDSPTGGALGNVSDTEGNKLDSSLASLKTTLSPSQMVTNLEKVRAARKTALKRVQEAYEADQKRVHRTILRTSARLLPEDPTSIAELYLEPEQISAIQQEFEAPNALAPETAAPARLTIGAAPAPAPAVEGPLVPAPSLEGMEVLQVNGKPTTESGTVDVGRFKGRVDQPTERPETMPAPAAPVAAPSYQYPVYSVLGAAERMPPIGEAAMNVVAAPGRAIDAFGRLGGAALQGVMTGNYQVPEKGIVERAGEAIGGMIAGRTVGEERELMRREDETLRARPNSWEAYDIRRKRGMPEPARQGPGYTSQAVETPAPAVPARREAPVVTEEAPVPAPTPAPIRLTPEQVDELSQIKLSPESTKTARRLLSEYQAGQKAGRREQPVLEITASDGKRRSFTVENPEIADQLIAILTGQQAPNLEPRLEPDREGTRRLGEERMRREEVARQFRSMPRR